MELKLDNIYQGDCLELMKFIPDNSIDAVICDLPYGTTACAWDSVIPFDKLWEQYRRICKPNAAVVLFGSEPFSTLQRMSNFKDYRYDWIWCKDYPVGHLNANKMPMKQHELISVFYNSLPTYNPQKTNIGKKVHIHRTGPAEVYNYAPSIADKIYDGNYPTSLLHFKHDRTEDSKGLHPTQKPVDLLRYLVLTYTNEGDVVLDNCSGSGSTAVACWKEKRHFICIEKDPVYYEKSVKRLKIEMAQLRLF